MKRAVILGISMMVYFVWGQSIEEYVAEGKTKIAGAISRWDQEGMLEARAFFERIQTTGKKEWLLNYYIAYCDYRLTNYAFSKEDAESAKKYLNDGIERLKQSIEENPNFADAHALLSSLYGNKIGLSPWSGFWYGPKAGKEMSRALALEPENPRVHLIQGISYYFTPKMWGGGKEKAVEELNQAIQLYEHVKVVDSSYPDWGRDDAYAWLGVVLKDLELFHEARIALENGLRVNPENGWIKYELIPQLDEAISKK